MELLKFSDDGRKVELNHAVLDKVTKNVEDRPVVVVSVVGAYRRGKSFLLNFLLKYLKSKGSSTWLDDRESQLEGFSWRFDVNRVTTGVLIWPQAFLINNMAVVIMDTQGTFDNMTTMQESTAIVATSVLLSSLTIFNISEHIESKDLDNLRYFLEYGGLAYEKINKTQRPFQEFMFLLRDWKFDDEHQFGYEGGREYLDSVLTAGMDKEELQNVKVNLENSFEKTSCFLMPFPGGKVARDRKFQGKLSEINENFLTYMRVLVESILAPENLKPKRVGNHEIRMRDLSAFLHSLTTAFNSKELPNTGTLLQMFSETVAKSMVHQAHATYDAYMKEILSSGKCINDLSSIQEKVTKETVLKLRTSIKLGSESLINLCCDQLAELLKKSYESHFVPLNEDRKRIVDTENKVTLEKARTEEQAKIQQKLQGDMENIDTELKDKIKKGTDLEENVVRAQKNTEKIAQEVNKSEAELAERQKESEEQKQMGEKINEEYRASEIHKQNIVEFFTNLTSFLDSNIASNCTMTMFELHAAILQQFSKQGFRSGSTKPADLLSGYANALNSIEASDPRGVFLKIMADNLRENDGDQVDSTLTTQHFQAFKDKLNEVTSGLM